MCFFLLSHVSHHYNIISLKILRVFFNFGSIQVWANVLPMYYSASLSSKTAWFVLKFGLIGIIKMRLKFLLSLGKSLVKLFNGQIISQIWMTHNFWFVATTNRISLKTRIASNNIKLCQKIVLFGNFNVIYTLILSWVCL